MQSGQGCVQADGVAVGAALPNWGAPPPPRTPCRAHVAPLSRVPCVIHTPSHHVSMEGDKQRGSRPIRCPANALWARPPAVRGYTRCTSRKRRDHAGRRPRGHTAAQAEHGTGRAQSGSVRERGPPCHRPAPHGRVTTGKGKKAMRRGVMTLLGLICCLLCVRAVAGAPDRVYTVSQVLTGLQRDPRAWVGRTALVRGAALLLLPGCGATAWCPAGLYEPHTRRPGPILLLEPGPANPLWGRLRRVPILGDVVPRPQHMHDQTSAVYRLRFQAVSHRSCDAHPCVNALLVDAAPSSTP